MTLTPTAIMLPATVEAAFTEAGVVSQPVPPAWTPAMRVEIGSTFVLIPLRPDSRWTTEERARVAAMFEMSGARLPTLADANAAVAGLRAP